SRRAGHGPPLHPHLGLRRRRAHPLRRDRHLADSLPRALGARQGPHEPRGRGGAAPARVPHAAPASVLVAPALGAPGCHDRQRAPRETRTMAKKPEKTEKPEKLEKTEEPEPPEKPEPPSLLELVAALDRQHRRLRWTVVALTLVTLVALAGAGAALVAPYNAELGLYLRRWLGRPETIAAVKTILEAEKFALRTPADKEGRTGALVDVVDDGSRLGLFYDGLVRAGIGFGPGGSQLNLYGEDGKDHATLSLAPDGATGLIFHGQDGKQRAALGVAPNNASGLSLFDKGGSHRAALSVVPDGSPRLELFDAGGGRRANLALSGEGLPALQLEEKGQPRAVLGAGSEGKRKASTPSSLLLFDKDGSVIFQ